MRAGYVLCPAVSGPPPSMEMEFFLAQGRADLGQTVITGRVLPCTGVRAVDL